MSEQLLDQNIDDQHELNRYINSRGSMTTDDSINSDIKHINDDVNSDNFTFEQPSSVLSPTLYDYKTPPMQTGTTFPELHMSNVSNNNNSNNNNNNSTRYDDIQNLPTPIAPNNYNTRREKPYFFGSPVEETSGKKDFINLEDKGKLSPIIPNTNHNSSSALRIPKTRQQSHSRRNILVETNNLSLTGNNTTNDEGKKYSNQNQRFISDYKIRDRNEISDQQLQMNIFENISQQQHHLRSFQKPPHLSNIKPVDRVVSLPVHKIDTHENLINIERHYKTSDIPESSEKEELPVHSLHFITYSIDESKRIQHWNISYEVGAGAFSKVYLANDSKTAIKVTDVNFNKSTENSEELRLRIQNSLTRELTILKTLKHPNIIQLLGSDYIDDNESSQKPIDRIIMAMDYCKGGDLFSFVLEHRSSMSIHLISCIFSNIVSAIYYMHHKNICHRDIKLENILLKYNQLDLLLNGIEYTKSNLPIVVLSDFGLSKEIDPNDPMLSTRCGSEDYVSPELLLGMPYDGKQNDCWSLGVVLYTILESRLPFDQLPNEKIKSNTRTSKPSHRIAMISWTWYTIKNENSESYKLAKQIVKSLLTKRNKRATIDQVADNEWCSDYVIRRD